MALRDLLIHCANLFYQMPRYATTDLVLGHAIDTYPTNTDLRDIYTKVTLLNSLYSTKVFDTYGLSEHILNENIDERIRQGDIRVVDDIRSGHGIRIRRTGKERNLYSFATKYIHWHSPGQFPVFDNLVKRLLPNMNRTERFHERFTQVDLEDYSFYCDVINSLTVSVQLNNFRYQSIDKALWVYAKYLYRNNQLPPEIVAEIRDAI